jgi:peroxiredoxin
LQRTYEQFKADGAEVVAMTVASVESVQSWCQKGGIEYPMLADVDHVVADVFDVTEATQEGRLSPAVFIIGTDRSIVWYHAGAHYQDYVAVEEILTHVP